MTDRESVTSKKLSRTKFEIESRLLSIDGTSTTEFVGGERATIPPLNQQASTGE